MRKLQAKKICKKTLFYVYCRNNDNSVMYLFSYKVSFYAKPEKLSRHAQATFLSGLLVAVSWLTK